MSLALLWAGCGSGDAVIPERPIGPGCEAGDQYVIVGDLEGATVELFVSLQSDFSPTDWREAWVTDVTGADLIQVMPQPQQQPMGKPQFNGQTIEVILGFDTDGGVPDPTSGTFLLHSLLGDEEGGSNGTCDLLATITFNVDNGKVSAGSKQMPTQ